jgi:peptidoglycan/xylan/chitin deacetylase (PgdA/CDA1 family)
MATGRLSGFPVLMYHGVTRDAAEPVPPGERKYWVTAAQLREHLLCIQDAGCRVARLSELWRSPATTGRRHPSVALSFDDGRVSDYEVAFPLLREADAIADFFVSTAIVGTPGHLTWPQIAEMQRAGMSFHSHSHDHVDLSRLSASALRRQLRESRRQLEDHLGTGVKFLAVPYGLVNSRVITAAREERYRAVCTSRAWPARPGASLIGRVAIYRHTGAAEVNRLVASRLGTYLARSMRAGLIYLPKQLVLRIRPHRLGVQVMEPSA